MAINLKPTDQCYVSRNNPYPIQNKTVTVEGIYLTVESTGPLGTFYSAAGDFSCRFAGGTQHAEEIVSKTLSPAIGSASATLGTGKPTQGGSWRISYDTRTYEGSTIGPLTLAINFNYREAYVNTNAPVFLIQNQNRSLMWRKQKPVTVTFDESMISSIEFSVDEYTGVGGDIYGRTMSEVNGLLSDLVVAGNKVSHFNIVPWPGYVLTNDRGLTSAVFDLSDVGALTTDSFAAASYTITAAPTFTGISNTGFTINTNYISAPPDFNSSAVISYISYVDSSAATGYDGLIPDGECTLSHFDFAYNKEAKMVVPVAYETNDEDLCTTNYYVGQEILPDGNTYDKWRSIENGEGVHTWDEGTGAKYLYTPVIVSQECSARPPVIASYSRGYNTETSGYYATVTLTNPNSYPWIPRIYLYTSSNQGDEWLLLDTYIGSSYITPGSQKSYSFSALPQVSADWNIIVRACFVPYSIGYAQTVTPYTELEFEMIS